MSKKRKYPAPCASRKSRSETTVYCFFLAHEQLQQETGVVYVHLHLTHLKKSVRLIDATGYMHELPLDHLGFVIQQKAVPFIPTLQTAIEQHQTETAKKMIDSLIELIDRRCSKGITDLDNIANDNYGWLENHAIHLDIGRFTTQQEIIPSQEIIRVTQPLSDYLEKNSPELFQHYVNKLQYRY